MIGIEHDSNTINIDGYHGYVIREEGLPEKHIAWPEIFNGPYCLSDSELEVISQQLVHGDLDTLNKQRFSYLENPNGINSRKPYSTSIIMHDGTSQNSNWETDIADAEISMNNPVGKVQGLGAYTMGRAFEFSRAGDIYCGHGNGKSVLGEILASEGVERIEMDANNYSPDAVNAFFLEPNLPTDDSGNFYYLSHQLLDAAVNNDPRIDNLVEIIASLDRPPLFRFYAFDKPFQIFLNYLYQQVNGTRLSNNLAPFDKFYLEANSPEAGKVLNSKTAFHPEIGMVEYKLSANRYYTETIADMDYSEGVQRLANEMLKAEHLLSPFGHLIGKDNIDKWQAAPGYSVLGSSNDYVFDLERAAMRLKKLYGIENIRIKLARSSDGDGVSGAIGIRSLIKALESEDLSNLDLKSQKILSALIQKPADLVIEVNMEPLITSVSNHMLKGEQSIHSAIELVNPDDETKWIGNIVANTEQIAQIIGKTIGNETATESIEAMLESNKTLFAAIAASDSYQISIAGLDYMIGYFGGVFGEEIKTVATDANIRFTGAMPLKIFLDSNPNHNIVMGKALDANLIPYQELTEIIKDFNNGDTKTPDSETIAKIIFYTGGKLMLAVSGKEHQQVNEKLVQLEELFTNAGILKQTA